MKQTKGRVELSLFLLILKEPAGRSASNAIQWKSGQYDLVSSKKYHREVGIHPPPLGPVPASPVYVGSGERTWTPSQWETGILGPWSFLQSSAYDRKKSQSLLNAREKHENIYVCDHDRNECMSCSFRLIVDVIIFSSCFFFHSSIMFHSVMNN